MRFFSTAPSSFLRLRRSNHRSQVERSHPAPHVSDMEQDSAQRPAPKCRESPAPQHARAHSRVLVATGASFPLVFCLGTGWMGPIRDKLFDPWTPASNTSILCLQQLGRFPHYSMWQHGCRHPTIFFKSKRIEYKLVQSNWKAIWLHISRTRKTLITIKLKNLISMNLP